MIKAHTASIVHEDARIAGRDLALELLDELGDKPDLVLMFVSARYNLEAVVNGFHQACGPGVQVAGCSSYAEIDDTGGKTDSATAMGFKFGSGISATTMSGTPENNDARGLGQRLGRQAKEVRADLVIAFPDGLSLNQTQFMFGLQDVLGASFPIIGGGAADLGQFKETFQIRDREVISGGASMVALSGPIKLVTAVSRGWIPVGATRRITRMENGNVCLEMDGRPALDLYEEYLGPRTSEMPGVSIEYPVGVVGGLPEALPADDCQILRLQAVVGVDYARRSLVFNAEIPEGAEVRMTTTTRSDVIAAANNAGARIVQQLPKANVALMFTCMARKIVLGPRYREELENTLQQLGGIPRVGFYSYGEIAPVNGIAMCHGETFTIALLEA